jgi:hypothetical protein
MRVTLTRRMETFFLGTHRPHWLASVDVPLMVTFRQLQDRKTFPRALGAWWQDSNGFTELSLFGEYRTSARDYVTATRRHMAEVGNVIHVSPQDWMCEPAVREKTGLSVAAHQLKTIENYQQLRDMAPEVPWVPVVQGWDHGDYLRHVDTYARAGVNLMDAPVVGLGTVCRRQATGAVEGIVRSLSNMGLRLHAFGMKAGGLARVAPIIASADSLAWSFRARKIGQPVCGSVTHKNCANCLVFALRWRYALLEGLPRVFQMGLRLS